MPLPLDRCLWTGVATTSGTQTATAQVLHLNGLIISLSPWPVSGNLAFDTIMYIF